MKSIKCFVVVALLSSAMSMQAMNQQGSASPGKKRSHADEQPSPFAATSSDMQRQIASQFERAECELMQKATSAYYADMQKLVTSLGSTHQNNIIFPQANCCKIGDAVYFVDQKRVTPANFPPYYVDDPEALRRVVGQHSYQREQGLGNVPTRIGILPAQMGRLADILLARALFTAANRDKGGTPDDIRTDVLLSYTEYSKEHRHCLVDNTPTPISSETINKELKALSEIKFDYTLQKIDLSIIEVLSPLIPSSVIIDQIPHYRDYLLKMTCAQYCKAKAKVIMEDLHAKYSKAFNE